MDNKTKKIIFKTRKTNHGKKFLLMYCSLYYVSLFSFVTISLGLSACNSSGHLSNHAEVAPSHAGLTFAISNTLVGTSLLMLFNHCFYIKGNYTTKSLIRITFSVLCQGTYKQYIFIFLHICEGHLSM